jgi:hypothetical protein
MKVCVMTKSKSMISIIDAIEFNKERTKVTLIEKKSTIGELDLTLCELKKLDRTDGNMEYYEIIEKENL